MLRFLQFQVELGWVSCLCKKPAQSCCPLLSASHAGMGTEHSKALFPYNHLVCSQSPHPDSPEETRAVSSWLLSQANQRAANSWQMLLETKLITHQEGCPAEEMVLTLFKVWPQWPPQCRIPVSWEQRPARVCVGTLPWQQMGLGSQEPSTCVCVQGTHLEQHQ